jgi:hypothetical protein
VKPPNDLGSHSARETGLNIIRPEPSGGMCVRTDSGDAISVTGACNETAIASP